MMKKKVFIVVGTRPEAIKMAPVYKALKRKTNLDTKLTSTGQHKELLGQAMEAFGLRPDHDLMVMKPGQSLSGLTGSILSGLERLFAGEKPDLVLIHGDTTSSFSAALSSFYHSIPVAHVEAGLRTYQIDSPFPEEFNRQGIARLAALHFAPTRQARENLLREGIPEKAIMITGSTVIDAIQEILDQTRKYRLSMFMNGIDRSDTLGVITLHRRENLGRRLSQVLSAIRETAVAFNTVLFVYPMHPNPVIRQSAYALLGDVPNVQLTDPMNYVDFIRLLLRSHIILTDSGGIQEEGRHLGKHVLLLRDHTERGEGLANGCTEIIGADSTRLKAALARILSERACPCFHELIPDRMGASEKIADIVSSQFLGQNLFLTTGRKW